MKTAKGNIKNIYAIRLEPGEFVLEGLRKACELYNIRHGVILSALGSLEGASFFVPKEIPGRPGEYAYIDPIKLEGIIELVDLSGIICENDDGSTNLHVHYSISDSDGHGYAGHLDEDNKVFATLDCVIGEIEGIFMGRSIDPKFGLPLFNPRQL